MADQVRVDDLDIFRLFRAEMIKFHEVATQALSNAESDILRAQSWLEGEQTSFWQMQLRKRTEAVTKARDTLRGKKMFKNAAGRTPDTIEEEKALQHCQRQQEEAENKLKAIRMWRLKLEKEAGVYRGGVARFQATVFGDLPKAIALLDRLGGALEDYTEITTPEAATIETDTGATGESSMSRGEDASMAREATEAPAPAPAPGSSATAQDTTPTPQQAAEKAPDSAPTQEKRDVAP